MHSSFRLRWTRCLAILDWHKDHVHSAVHVIRLLRAVQQRMFRQDETGWFPLQKKKRKKKEMPLLPCSSMADQLRDRGHNDMWWRTESHASLVPLEQYGGTEYRRRHFFPGWQLQRLFRHKPHQLGLVGTFPIRGVIRGQEYIGHERSKKGLFFLSTFKAQLLLAVPSRVWHAHMLHLM